MQATRTFNPSLCCRFMTEQHLLLRSFGLYTVPICRNLFLSPGLHETRLCKCRDNECCWKSCIFVLPHRLVHRSLKFVWSNVLPNRVPWYFRGQHMYFQIKYLGTSVSHGEQRMYFQIEYLCTSVDNKCTSKSSTLVLRCYPLNIECTWKSSPLVSQGS